MSLVFPKYKISGTGKQKAQKFTEEVFLELKAD